VVAAAAAVALAVAAFYHILCRDVPHASLSIVLLFTAGRGSHTFGTDSFAHTCCRLVGNRHFRQIHVSRLDLFSSSYDVMSP
jgi:hypothetical protein